MDGGDLPGFYPTRVIFFCIAGGMALADVFDARFGVVPFSAPRLRLVTELKLFCRCTAISPCSGNLFFYNRLVPPRLVFLWSLSPDFAGSVGDSNGLVPRGT